MPPKKNRPWRISRSTQGTRWKAGRKCRTERARPTSQSRRDPVRSTPKRVLRQDALHIQIYRHVRAWTEDRRKETQSSTRTSILNKHEGVRVSPCIYAMLSPNVSPPQTPTTPGGLDAGPSRPSTSGSGCGPLAGPPPPGCEARSEQRCSARLTGKRACDPKEPALQERPSSPANPCVDRVQTWGTAAAATPGRSAANRTRLARPESGGWRERERGERERDGGRERATDRRADHERDIAGQSSTNEKDCRGTPAKQRMCPWQARMRVPHMWNLPLLSSCTNRVSPDLSPPPCGAGESAHRGHSLEGSGWNTTKHT